MSPTNYWKAIRELRLKLTDAAKQEDRDQAIDELVRLIISDVLEDELPDFDEFVKSEDLIEAIDWSEIIREHDIACEDDLSEYVMHEELGEAVEAILTEPGGEKRLLIADEVQERIDSLRDVLWCEIQILHTRQEQFEAIRTSTLWDRLRWLFLGW